MKRVLAAVALSALAVSTPAKAGLSIVECIERAHCELHGPCPFPFPCDPPQSPPEVAVEQAVPRNDPVQVQRVDQPHAPQAMRAHIIVGRNIRTIADLSGKQVSFGPPGSSARDAGRQLFRRLRVDVNETPLDIANAIDGVSSGDISAVVIWSRGSPPPGLHILDVSSAR